jgi:hypothetical protein
MTSQMFTHPVLRPPHKLRIELVEVTVEFLADFEEHLINLFLQVVLLENLLNVVKEGWSCNMNLILEDLDKIGLLEFMKAFMIPKASKGFNGKFTKGKASFAH